MAPNISVQLRGRIVGLCEGGKSFHEISTLTGCSVKTIRRWIRAFRAGGIHALHDHRVRNRRPRKNFGEFADASATKTPRKRQPYKAYCCVVGCDNTTGNPPGTRFYSFPTATFEHRRLRCQKWIDAVRRQNPDGSPWYPTKNSRICSSHFIGNAKSEDPTSPAYNPTIFPDVYHKPMTDEEIAAGRRQRRKLLMNNAEPLSSLYMETESKLENQNTAHSGTESQEDTEGEETDEDDFDKILIPDCLIGVESCPTTAKSIATQVNFPENSDNPDRRVIWCNRYITPTTCEALVQTCLPPAVEEKAALRPRRKNKAAARVDKSCDADVRIEDVVWTGRANFKLRSADETQDRFSWDLVDHKLADNAQFCRNYLPDSVTPS